MTYTLSFKLAGHCFCSFHNAIDMGNDVILEVLINRPWSPAQMQPVGDFISAEKAELLFQFKLWTESTDVLVIKID